MLGTVLAVEQGSPEWFRARLGLLTGSRAGDMLTTLKSGGESAARRQLRIQLACERLTGRSAAPTFQSRDMARGTALESAALAAYEAATGTIARRVGFIRHDALEAGCSPDALVADGIVEIKCPTSAVHCGYLMGPAAVPPEYVGQVVHNLWMTGGAFCDFVSFDDRFPPALQVWIVRYRRPSAADLAAYELAARQFLEEVTRQTQAIAALLRAAA